jgi:hypothetical protein
VADLLIKEGVMNKITILLLLIVGLWITEAYAQEADQALSPDAEQAESVQPEVYVFPVIQPEFTLTGGYRYVHVNGSSRAEEFEYLHDSLVLGGELRTVSLNQRLHLDLDVRNGKDYYGDISYAYKDLVLFRAVNSTLFHNLDNIMLFTFGPSQLALNKDPKETYGLKVGISNLLLRLKVPDFPAHLYVEGNFVDKDGTEQQMFYKQFTSSADNTRTSGKRDIDSLTSVYTIGANSHLGPVEADVSHSEKRFDVDGDRILVDTIGAGSNRTEGDYYHNLIPELKSSTNTLKLHTSYTGGLVASATLSQTDKENRDSGAKADYFFAAGDITWMPMTQLTFFLKYRHQERDVDNSDTVTVQNLTDLSKYSYAVRDSISSISDSVSGTVRYRPLKGVMLKADYAYEDIRREDVAAWFTIPDSTQRQKLSLSGDVRIMANLKLNAKYIHKDINNPATNIEPDHSDEGQLRLSWMPLPGLNTFVSYDIKKEKRDSLDFVTDTDAVIHADNRKVNNDRLIGTVSYALFSNLSATASFAYMHDKVRQDIRIAPAYRHEIPYKTTARNYSFDVHYNLKSFISLDAGISHTVSQGMFYNLDSIASFSELKIRETTYSASGEYQSRGGYTAGIQYRYTTFKDVLDNIYNDVNDGRASIILLTISKKW